MLTTEDTERTERATPETDGKASPHIGFYSCATVPADFARKLERERDKAREDATNYYARIGELEKERDEAIADRDILRIDAQREAEHHDRMVGELQRVYKERDEAREALAAAKHYLTKERDDALAQIVQAECRAERFCQERDEARSVIRMLWCRSQTHLDLSEEELDRVNRSLGETAK